MHPKVTFNYQYVTEKEYIADYPIYLKQICISSIQYNVRVIGI